MKSTGDNRLRKIGSRIFAAFASPAIAATVSLELVGLRDGCLLVANQRRPRQMAESRRSLRATLALVLA